MTCFNTVSTFKYLKKSCLGFIVDKVFLLVVRIFLILVSE